MMISGLQTLSVLALAAGILVAPLQAHAQSASACVAESLGWPGAEVAQLLREARADITETLKQSPNYGPIRDFVAEESSPIERIVESKPIEGLGTVRIVQDPLSKGGRVELVADKSSRVLFDSSQLEAGLRGGRVQSVRVSEDGARIISVFRTFSRTDNPFIEVSRPLRPNARKSLGRRARKALGRRARKALADLRGKVLIWGFRPVAEVELDGGAALAIRDYGNNAPTDAWYFPTEGAGIGKGKLAFSTFAELRNGREQYRDYSQSSDKRFVILKTNLDGSTDRFRLHVFDAREQKVIRVLDAGNGYLKWDSAHVLRYPQYDPGPGYQELTLDLANARAEPKAVSQKPEVPRMKERVDDLGEEVVYVSGENSRDPEGIAAVSRAGFESGKDASRRWLYRAEKGLLIEGALIRDGFVIVKLRSGAKRSRVVIDASGKRVGEMPVPSCCSLTGLQWKVPGKVLKATFASAVRSGVEAEYDLASKSWSDPTFEAQALVRDGKTYVSEIIEVTSADGSRVPVRITRLASLAKDGKNPALMEVYGGFNLASPGFDPSFDGMKFRFLRQGGILVGAAVRGGSEFGEAWHNAGKGLNKARTYEDVAAAAEYLSSSGLSQGSRIALSGASNGGLTVAASALRRPELFGLVIPMNGVLDLTRAEALDPKFRGWKYEYGEDSDARSAANKQALSPVESVERLRPQLRASGGSLPEFLIINGAADSRVNPRHSENFFRALRQAGQGRAQLLVAPNSGHWNYSPNYQDVIGWHVRAAIWTRIFDFSGLRFDHAPTP